MVWRRMKFVVISATSGVVCDRCVVKQDECRHHAVQAIDVEISGRSCVRGRISTMRDHGRLLIRGSGHET